MGKSMKEMHDQYLSLFEEGSEKKLEELRYLSYLYATYMTFRANQEKNEHRSNILWYFVHLSIGMNGVNGIYHEDGELVCDEQNPNAFYKWNKLTEDEGGLLSDKVDHLEMTLQQPEPLEGEAQQWFKKYHESIRGKRFLNLNMYEQLGISYEANEQEIVQAYSRVLMEHHPEITKKSDHDSRYIAIQKAFNTLMDSTMRLEYDSIVDFDENIPSGQETISQHASKALGGNGKVSGTCFYELYGPVFLRNARFSKIVPVPSFGDATADIHQVLDFYNFYLRFDSWRTFYHDAIQHESETAQHRADNRYVVKKQKTEAKKKKKAEYVRLSNLVNRAMAADPRIRRHKYEEKMAKEIVKKAKEDHEQEVSVTLKKQEDNILQIEQEMKALTLKNAKLKKDEKEKAKKKLRKNKKMFRELMDDVCSHGLITDV